jgi:tetratricopeptide (TPR) repeat protein
MYSALDTATDTSLRGPLLATARPSSLIRYGLAYRNRGNAKRKKGDLDGAIADFNRAIELGVTNH